jgi:hypothetical protein
MNSLPGLDDDDCDHQYSTDDVSVLEDRPGPAEDSTVADPSSWSDALEEALWVRVVLVPIP